MWTYRTLLCSSRRCVVSCRGSHLFTRHGTCSASKHAVRARCRGPQQAPWKLRSMQQADHQLYLLLSVNSSNTLNWQVMLCSSCCGNPPNSCTHTGGMPALQQLAHTGASAQALVAAGFGTATAFQQRWDQSRDVCANCGAYTRLPVQHMHRARQRCCKCQYFAVIVLLAGG